MFALQLQYPIFAHETGVIALNNQLGNGHTDTLANFMLTRLARDRVRGLSAIMPVVPSGGAVGNNITLTGTNRTDFDGGYPSGAVGALAPVGYAPILLT